MASPVWTLPGKVNASNALVVTGQATGTQAGGVMPVSSCQGKVDSSNRLVIKFV